MAPGAHLAIPVLAGIRTLQVAISMHAPITQCALIKMCASINARLLTLVYGNTLLHVYL